MLVRIAQRAFIDFWYGCGNIYSGFSSFLVYNQEENNQYLKTKAQIPFLTTLKIIKCLKFATSDRVYAETAWKGVKNSGE